MHRLLYWSFESYDCNLNVVTGVTVGRTFAEVALNLRQNGLIIIRANQIDQSQYKAHLQLSKMKKFVASPTTSVTDTTTNTTIHNSLLKIIASLFKRRNA